MTTAQARRRPREQSLSPDGGADVANPPALLEAVDVARRLSLTLPRVYELARLNRLPGVVRLGRQVRFDGQKIEAFIASGGAALDGGWRREAN